jgi:hypothetical protein
MDRPDDLTWLPVPGWEGLYEVSNTGLVRGIKRRRGTRGGQLKTPLDGRGYLQLNLCRDGQPVHTFVHTLVAEAFHGPRPAGMECRHLDGDKLNNTPANLRWGTATENNLDCVRHGTHYAPYRDVSHCVHGHEFSEENTGIRANSNRFCIACRKRRSSEQAARRKARRKASA